MGDGQVRISAEVKMRQTLMKVVADVAEQKCEGGGLVGFCVCICAYVRVYLHMQFSVSMCVNARAY